MEKTKKSIVVIKNTGNSRNGITSLTISISFLFIIITYILKNYLVKFIQYFLTQPNYKTRPKNNL